MHTEEWWWQTQTELLSSAILVLLLISTDKTMLTQHQSDISVWLIYLTIENLNQHTRQNQSKFELILLDFLSQVENDSDNIKSRVWHMILLIILKCVFTLMWCFILLFLLTISSNWDHCKTRLWCSMCRWTNLTMLFCDCWLHDELWETGFDHRY